jgi:hypothetical protein
MKNDNVKAGGCEKRPTERSKSLLLPQTKNTNSTKASGKKPLRREPGRNFLQN